MKFKAFCMIPHAGEIEIKPLVLCRECKYLVPELAREPYEGACRYWNHHSTKKDWYCTNGEKGENDEAD